MDVYEIQKSDPELFPQFSIEDNLILYYTCPQLDKVLNLYSKHICINFTLRGKRKLSHGNNTWVHNTNKGLLIKKCAFLQELPSDYTGWDVLVFYLKDDYLRSIFDKFRSPSIAALLIYRTSAERIRPNTACPHLHIGEIGLISKVSEFLRKAWIPGIYYVAFRKIICHLGFLSEVKAYDFHVCFPI